MSLPSILAGVASGALMCAAAVKSLVQPQYIKSQKAYKLIYLVPVIVNLTLSNHLRSAGRKCLGANG